MNVNEGISTLPLFLNKINSDKKAIECANTLEACHPTHAQRLWLAGFLKFCGYSMAEVLDIIREQCHWSDYNERITAQQVASVFHQRPQRTQNHCNTRPRKWDLSPLDVLKIRYQRSVTLSGILCEENKSNTTFPHPERLVDSKFNPSAEFLKK